MAKIDKKRIIEIDVARAVAIMAVVLIHVSSFAFAKSTLGTVDSRISLFLNQISRFSVPLFVFISGVGLSLGYKKEKGYFYFLSKRLRKVVPSYLVWGLIYVIVINQNYDISTWPKLFLKGDKIYYHLYFIPMIITLYLLFPIFYSKIKKFSWAFFLFVITSIIIGTSHYFNIPNLKLDFFSKRNALFWSGYFVLGVYISDGINNLVEFAKHNKKKVTILMVLSTVIIVMESFLNIKYGKTIDYATTFIRPTVIIYFICITLYIFSRSYKEGSWVLKIFHNISKRSFGIYLIHPFILYYYMKLFQFLNFNIGSLFFIITSFFVCIIIPIFLVKN